LLPFVTNFTTPIICIKIIPLSSGFQIFPQKFLAHISHNVPAVYDVFAVAIKEREAFQQPQKCGGEKPHKGR
jgi:hypothetical protein